MKNFSVPPSFKKNGSLARAQVTAIIRIPSCSSKRILICALWCAPRQCRYYERGLRLVRNLLIFRRQVALLVLAEPITPTRHLDRPMTDTPRLKQHRRFGVIGGIERRAYSSTFDFSWLNPRASREASHIDSLGADFRQGQAFYYAQLRVVQI
jgi:hypothetical protein